MAKPRTRVTSVEEYLAHLGADQRTALEKIRKAIKSAAPDAEECISYQLAAFRVAGRPLVAFGATANHCSFYPMSDTTVAAHKDELKRYETSKGTIRFQPERPLSVALVRKLVKARLTEIGGHAPGKAKKPAPGKRSTTTQSKASTGKRRPDPAIERFLKELSHPLKKEIETLRRVILSVGPEVSEEFKWNSPSFRTTDHFATLNVRGEKDKSQVLLILHTGAKKKNMVMKGKVSDPAGLIKWLGKDRGLITFADKKDVSAKTPSLKSILKSWISEL